MTDQTVSRFQIHTRAATGLLALYWCSLFVGTHLPRVPGGGLHVSDKLLHFLAYAGLSCLVAIAFSSRQRRGLRLYLVIFLSLATYGAVDELLQVPIPNRYGDPIDWCADVCGILAGLAVHCVAMYGPGTGKAASTAKPLVAPSVGFARNEG